MKKNILNLILLLSLFSCVDQTDTVPESPSKIEGLRPIYSDVESTKKIQAEKPMALKKPGKIYIWNQYIFINERYEGVHIIDNSNPENPTNIGFIKIPGNVDIAVKGEILYADNYTDLVAINISDPTNAILAKRIENMYPEQGSYYPPENDVFFECVDSSKGVVIGWEEALLENPKCYR